LIGDKRKEGNYYALFRTLLLNRSIGQNRDVKVYYLFYRHTIQEKALQLIGSKMEASLAIEGKFNEEGPLAMT